MRKFSSVLLAGLLSSSLYGASFYIGAGVTAGTGSQTLEFDDTDDTYTSDYDTDGLTAKIGFIGSNGNRLEISANQINVSDDYSDDTYTGLELNYLITLLPDSGFNPYIGLGLGYYESDEMTGYNTETLEEENAHALSLGASVGLLLGFEHFEIEVAYQYRYLTWNYEDFDLYDEISNAYLGANIKF